ncbi:MAG TPA: hypothetical protein VFQ77_07455 [Pseudonocardiaceae bacterium]|jgi:hypothetical protein|nr:hypothetical protein [Pseudonocardiaceae bacterium]
MGAITSLEHRSIAVQPGAEAICSVLVRNTGTVVDQFTVEVLGDASAWAQVDPATVNLLPNEESTVVVRFQPPRSSEVAAGIVPFGLRVSPREDPAGTVVEEGTLEIGTFTDVRVELIPRRARGRRQARCDVAVDNLGNHPVTLGIEADDPDRNLRFRPERTELRLQPGTTAFVALTMRPERGFLRGPEQTHPFQVRVNGADIPPTTAEGAMVQQPLLPKWLPLAIAALLAVLIALVALWFTVVKTTVQSSAREAAAQQVQQVAQTANEARDRAEEAAVKAGLPPKPKAGTPGQDGAAAAPTSPGAPTTTPAAPTSPAAPGGPPVREPTDFRIAANNARQATGPDDFTFFVHEFPAGKTVLISDLVLQNPFGDSGIVRIIRVVGADPAKGDVLLEVGLSNFRDLDYHFLQPWQFKPGEKIGLAVNCQNPPLPGDPNAPNPCNPSASFLGQLEGPASPAPTTPPATTTTAPPAPTTAPPTPTPAPPAPTTAPPAPTTPAGPTA